ncbi:hypothetical protein [Methylobacterium iners]|uniref:Uncharacterized protein n=1 Tax=Methylobacterium iners TaxID=418707 RepID=A0ABQ4S230_9HYPH|nr:hypothetical protein [Methylobacterium iners]GJD96916.1 hypothetical protein OCOJLMKI_4143 [Methylobacterium iners]
MTPELRQELVSRRVEGIDAALLQIGLGRDAKDAALTFRAYLIDLLGLIERNPGLDAAADDLQKSVHAVVEAGESRGIEDRQARLLVEAHARFRARLEAAGVEFNSEGGMGQARG